MNLTRAEREELNGLSKEVFRSSSRWQKLITIGYTELVTEEVTEYVPSEKEGEEGTTRQVRVPVKLSNGAHQYVTKHHSVASVKEYMLNLKKQIEEMRAMLKKQQEEAQAKKAQEEAVKKSLEEAQGSAL